MVQPLTDLARNLDLPKLKGKAAYTRAMKGYFLVGIWKREHDQAFLRLRVALTSEPVLKGPKYDGTPFIITTNGCKYGFAGMCTQRFTTVMPNGTEKTTTHPIGFSSKRTSTTEEKYKPFILEFGALKHNLDKFGGMIWGHPIEIETDCQALCDYLLSPTLNSMHARWRDAVLAYNIVDDYVDRRIRINYSLGIVKGSTTRRVHVQNTTRLLPCIHCVLLLSRIGLLHRVSATRL